MQSFYGNGKKNFMEVKIKQTIEQNLSHIRLYLAKAIKSSVLFRTYSGYVDLITGKIELGGVKPEGKQFMSVILSIKNPEKSSDICFYLFDTHEQLITSEKIGLIANKVVKKTLFLLNSLAHNNYQIFLEKGDFIEEYLFSKDFSPKRDQISIHPAFFGKIKRIDAEKILRGKKEGSYVIRDLDPVTEIERESLEKENHIHFDACLITFLQKEGVCSEYFIIHLGGNWWIYFDDPNFTSPKISFSSLKELICFQKELRIPIKR
jgi:hypothetical protein